MTDLHTRRMFLRAAAAASAAWAAADLAQVEEALAWAAQHPAHRAVGAASVLTREQAMVIDAMTSRILPSVDGRPGAHEAGVVAFIDKSLATFNAEQKQLYVDGVQELNRHAAERGAAATGAAGPGAAGDGAAARGAATAKGAAATGAGGRGASFATLTPAEQDAVLHEIEQTPFFQAVRFNTIVGMFALPTYGGNHDYAGWHMLGFEHQPAFQPPFGFYDAEVNRRG
jgi:gluconate 2-dehydrogenase gamma chain